MSLSDQKTGVLGTIGNLGEQVKSGAVSEVKKVVQNTVEQLGVQKEKKEGVADMSASPEMVAQQEQDKKAMLDALYGPSKPVEKGKEADLKTQLGFGEKQTTTANPLEQIGMGKSSIPTASVSENLNPQPVKTPEEEQKLTELKGQLHNEYYQKLTTPQTAPETEERMDEAREEQENAQQRMDRLRQEDLQEQQEKKEKQQPLDVVNAQNMEKNRGSSG